MTTAGLKRTTVMRMSGTIPMTRLHAIGATPMEGSEALSLDVAVSADRNRTCTIP